MPAFLVKIAALPKPLLLSICLIVLSITTPEVSALTGDSWCGTLMCVKATVNSTSVTYELKSLNQLGWMAIGFGAQMAGSPMVILWPNPDGNTTVSQRHADGHVQPTLDPSPPRQATISQKTDLTQETSPILAFDISKNNDTVQQLIWAFGVSRPESDDPSSTLEQHLDAGPFSLDLTKPVPSSTTSSSLLTTPTPSHLATPSLSPPSPISSPSTSHGSHGSHDRLLTAHAVLSLIGFLILLPFGALIARWGRTRFHGCILGPLSVSKRGRAHVVNEHQIGGVVLFALYILQLSLGTLVHLRQPKAGKMHPPRNIVHVGMGLIIIGFAFVQTKTGIDHDWEIASSLKSILSSVWAVWFALIPICYFVGLKLLRRQFDQERLGWQLPQPRPVALRHIVSEEEEIPNLNSDLRRIILNPVVTIDDGTHDMFSDQHRLPPAYAHSPDPGNTTEMRELERPLPISVHV
ncbi:hypothetical protein ABKN59_003764 [Abortiporus biennis]